MNTPIQLHRGDCMALMRDWDAETYDAIITDPPYASGGTSTASRKADPLKKYINSGTKKYYPSFDNDQRDQRTHMLWMTRWMEEALRLAKPGGWLMCFTDWRQLPLTSDALQVAGWTWRGIVPWDKTESCRPQKGLFRNQCEYVLTATKGNRRSILPCTPAGVHREKINPLAKLHMTGKPVALMEHLMSVLAPESSILDPFAGSATTLLAAQNKGHRCTGIELSDEYHKIAARRLGLILPA